MIQKRRTSRSLLIGATSLYGVGFDTLITKPDAEERGVIVWRHNFPAMPQVEVLNRSATVGKVGGNVRRKKNSAYS
jgi:hypothetical protein